jgi:hypothetical protein
MTPEYLENLEVLNETKEMERMGNMIGMARIRDRARQRRTHTDDLERLCQKDLWGEYSRP